MDAFAVFLCKRLRMRKINWSQGIIITLSFGIFQAAMPLWDGHSATSSNSTSPRSTIG